MPFCLNCGKEVPSGAKFCGSCGAPMQEAEGASAARQPTAPAPRVVVERTIVDSRPEGVRLLVTLSLLAGLVVVGFGVLLVILSDYVGGAALIMDLGAVFIFLGIATFVPRYGYSNTKSWSRSAGFGLGAAYILLGLFLMVLPVLTIQALGAASLAFGIANLYYITRPATKAYFQK